MPNSIKRSKKSIENENILSQIGILSTKALNSLSEVISVLGPNHCTKVVKENINTAIGALKIILNTTQAKKFAADGGSMHFNQMSDDAIMSIFNYFPLQKLILLRVVCSRWQAVIEMICQQKRSLRLFSTFDLNINYKLAVHDLVREDGRIFKVHNLYHDLVICGFKLTDEQIHCLIRLFSGAKQLVLYLSFSGWGGRNNLNIATLLEGLSASVTNLTLHGSVSWRPIADKTFATRLFLAINSMSSLKHFAFCFKELPEMPFHLLSQVMGQLEHFSFGDYGGDNIPIYSLLGPNCKHLSIPYYNGDLSLLLSRIISSKGHLANNLTHLQLDSVNKSDIPLVCQYFASLQMLDLKFGQIIKFDENVINHLSRLRYLSHLRINKVCVISLVSLNQPTPIALTGVKIFRIQMEYRKNFDCSNFCIAFARLFPSVEKFIIFLDYFGYDEAVYRQFDEELARHFPSLSNRGLQLNVEWNKYIKDDISSKLQKMRVGDIKW